MFVRKAKNTLWYQVTARQAAYMPDKGRNTCVYQANLDGKEHGKEDKGTIVQTLS